MSRDRQFPVEPTRATPELEASWQAHVARVRQGGWAGRYTNKQNRRTK